MSAREHLFARTRYASADHNLSLADNLQSLAPSPSPSPDESDNESWGTDDECDEANADRNDKARVEEAHGNNDLDEDSDLEAWTVPEVTPKPYAPLSSAALECYHKPWDVMYFPPKDDNSPYQHKTVTTEPAHINLKFTFPSPSCYLPPLTLGAKGDVEMATIGDVYQAIYKYFHAQETIQAIRDLGKSDADINAIRTKKRRLGDKHFDRFTKIDLLEGRHWVQSFTVESSSSSNDSSDPMVTWVVEMTRDQSD